MWPAQIGGRERQRDACRWSSAADADKRPEGGGGRGNRSAHRARTNTRAHVVGEAMPHPRERRGRRRESEVPPRDTALGKKKSVGDRTRG